MSTRLLAAFFALGVWGAPAQDIRGTISGTVTDPQGTSIVDAVVVVTNTDTNVSTTLTTNSSGFYQAPLLLAGPYQVTVEARGFKKTVRPNLVLAMRGQLRIDIQLEVGSLTESITISSESPLLDTSTVTVGKALTTRELADLPIMTNDIVLMARVAPGVVNQGTTQYLTQGQVGGSSGFFAPLSLGQNEWSIDGAPNLGSGGIAFTPFTDQIAEYKIETTSFDASLGHSIGLNIAFSTKSGTNSLHGSGTEQYWNTRWNAASFFVKQKYFQNIDAANGSGDTALAGLGQHPDRARRHRQLDVHEKFGDRDQRQRLGQPMAQRTREYDPSPRQWTPTNIPLPNRINITGIYELPLGRRRAFLKSGILSHVVGNWQVALTYDFQQGPSLTWPNDFYYGDLNRIGQTLTQGTKTLNGWFNASAPFERNSANGPASYQARVFPVDITRVRADGLNQWNANLRRDYRLREGTIFEVRMDALNLLNRSQFAAPDNNPFNTTFGVVSSTTSTLNRFYQLQGRIRF
jgi:hypothetical protein